jgi:hypothetical protein
MKNISYTPVHGNQHGPALGRCARRIEVAAVSGGFPATVGYATSATYAGKAPEVSTYWIQIQAYNKIIDN